MNAATAPAPVSSLRELLDVPARLHQHAIGLVAVGFLAIYGRLVCPFIAGIQVPDLLRNLLLVWVAQVAIRESLQWSFGTPPATRSIARHGYLLSLAT